MAMRKEKPKSAAYIKKRNKELSAIYNGLIEEFCAEQIEEVLWLEDRGRKRQPPDGDHQCGKGG